MALDTEEKQKGEAFQMNLKIVMLGLFDSFSFSLYLKIVNASFTDYWLCILRNFLEINSNTYYIDSVCVGDPKKRTFLAFMVLIL